MAPGHREPLPPSAIVPSGKGIREHLLTSHMGSFGEETGSPGPVMKELLLSLEPQASVESEISALGGVG